jgi:hypothetical protein
MVSARTTLRRLPSACEAAGAGAAAVRVAQPAIAARASTASAAFMNSVLSRQAGKRDFDVLTRLNPYDNQPTEPPDRLGNLTSLTSLHLDDTT